MKSDSEDAERELREQVARFSAFVRRTLRFWPSVPIALAVGGLACVGFLLWYEPEYRSETVVLYAQGPATGEAADSGAARNVTVRLKELLMSRPKLERVISEFNLYSNVRKEHGIAEAVEELEKHVEYRAPGGDTFSVAFVGASPVEAQRVTARLAALVIEQDSELRRNQARGTRDFLVTEKAKVEATLRSAERDLAAFMAEHPRFALDVTPLATGAAIRATTAPTIASPGALTSRVFAAPSSPLTGASSPRPAAPVAFAADSEVARATAAVAAARTHLAEQLEHYTEAHPDVRSAASAVERAESRLAALTGSSVAPSPATAPAPAAGAPAASSDRPAPIVRRPPSVPVRVARPAATGEPSGDVVALETEWLKLTRAATQARQRLDQVEAAFFKADILASSQSGSGGLQMTVIDPAYLPARPLPPGRTLIVAIFVAGALLIGVFVAMLRAIVDDRIFEAGDARGLAELLVVIPRARSPRRVHVPG